MFQLNVFFFIILTKYWTALASGETRESESPGSVLNFLKGDKLSLHMGCSGHCTIRSDGSGIWLRPQIYGKGKILILRLRFGVLHHCCQRGSQCWAAPEGLGPWDTSHCLWEPWRRSLVCQESLCECFFRGDVLQGELSFSALGGTKEVTLDDFHCQSQAVDEEVVWCMSGLSLYWFLKKSKGSTCSFKI